MNANELLEQLRAAGARLEPRLKVSGLPVDLLEALRAHKGELLKLLVSETTTATRMTSKDFKPYAKFGPVPAEGWFEYWRRRGRLPKDFTTEQLENMADKWADERAN